MHHEALVRGCLSAALASLPLVAQEGMPPLPPLPKDFQARTPGELIPLRPRIHLPEGEAKVPLRSWGTNVVETAEGWSMDAGAVQGPDLLLLADHIRYRVATDEIEAEGHIRLEGPGLRLRCGRLRMAWRLRMGEAWALEMELPPTWYLRSDKVAFSTLNHWDFEKVELSPCPQEQPGWKAQIARLTVDLDGFATIHRLLVWVGGVPTPYFLPWLIYPAKAERTSGILPTTLAFSGPNGASLQIPYYQVLGKTADLTFSPEYFTRQGTLWGGEARWNPEPTHQGSFTGEIIHQRTDLSNRFQFSLKELWQREDGIQLAADINRATDALLDADYGKGISNLGGKPYDSSLYVGKSLGFGSFSMTASDQRTFFQSDSTSPLYNPNYPNSLRRQITPSLQGVFFPVPLGRFYLDGGLSLSQMNYLMDLGNTPADLQDRYGWNRDDAFVRFQGRVGQWGPLRVDLQTLGRFTYYSHTLDSSLFNPSDLSSTGSNLALAESPFKVDGGSENRLLGSTRLQFSAPPVGRTFERVSLLGYSGEIKHTIDPFFAFSYTNKSSAEGIIPHFDDVDFSPGVAGSAAGEHSLELGVKQHFFGRSHAGASFLDLVRWKASVKYQFSPILLNDGRVQKGWGTVDNDIAIEPSESLRISFRSSNDITDSEADRSLSADYKAGDGTRFSLAYFATSINTLLVRQRGIQVGGLQRLWSDRVRLEAQANYDIQRHTFASSQVALAYVTPCVAWSLRFSHIGILQPGAASREDRLDLVLTLRGLGDLAKYTF